MVLSKDLQGEWLPVRNPHHLERRRRRSNPSSERRPLDSRNNRLLSYLPKSLTSRLLHSAACLSCKRCRRPLPYIRIQHVPEYPIPRSSYQSTQVDFTMHTSGCCQGIGISADI